MENKPEEKTTVGEGIFFAAILILAFIGFVWTCFKIIDGVDYFINLEDRVQELEYSSNSRNTIRVVNWE